MTETERKYRDLGTAKYSRRRYAWVETGQCHGCGHERACIATDSSMDEYGPVRLCRSCVDGFFDDAQADERPSILYRPTLEFRRGEYVAFYGKQCTGRGKTPTEAMAAFDRLWREGERPDG